ncbi:MAG TPA: hypothetical protein V6D08_08035 [Candidatus Obscuribacterales bacterium]
MAIQTHLSDTVTLRLSAEPLAEWQSMPARQLIGIWLTKMVAALGTAFKGSTGPEERPRPVPSQTGSQLGRLRAMRSQFERGQSESDQGSEIAEDGDLADQPAGSELSRRFKSKLDRQRVCVFRTALLKQKKQPERRD